MKLSEAIRLGSLLTKPIKNFFHSGDGACALGAAGFAIGQESYIGVERVYPWLVTGDADCPACPMIGCAPETIVLHLNDMHEWSRERIADWVATVEPKETEAQIVRLPTRNEHVGEGEEGNYGNRSTNSDIGDIQESLRS